MSRTSRQVCARCAQSGAQTRRGDEWDEQVRRVIRGGIGSELMTRKRKAREEDTGLSVSKKKTSVAAFESETLNEIGSNYLLVALVLFSSLYFFFIQFSLLDRNAEEARSEESEILTEDEMVGDRGRLVIAGSLRSFDVGNRIGATLKSNCEAPPIIRPN